MGRWELTREPTLKTTGEAERACDCGEKDTKSDIPALTDTTVWTKGDRTDPTLNGTGSEDYTSTDYGKVTITIPALSNETVWTKTSQKDATEEAVGEDVYESTDYGTVTVVLPALGHTHEWGGWTITTAPTLTETGTAQRVCTLNNTHIDTKTLPALRRFFNFFSQFFCFTLKKQCFAKNILLFCQKMIFCKSDFL